MNDLNNQQIVLLCLFVAFFTAIVTGITTVSLLDQAPNPVSQTINRVVEKTIETVVEKPVEGEPIIERVVETVIVNQEDLTITAVEKNSLALARIYNGSGTNKTFSGSGWIVNEKGQLFSDNLVGRGEKVTANIEGIDYSLKLLRSDGKFNLFEVEDVGTKTFTKISLANVSNAKLAQSVILLSGREANVVSTGVVTDIKNIVGADGSSIITGIDTSVDPSKIVRGSAIVNLQGEILGIWGGEVLASNTFITSNTISGFINQ